MEMMMSWRQSVARGLRAAILVILATGAMLATAPAQPRQSTSGQASPVTAPAAASNRWTLFVWMAADNDLEPAGIEDLKEIELGLPESGVEVIVFVDRAKQNNKRFGDWSGGRLYRMRPNKDDKTLRSELLQEFGPIDSSDPKLLTQQLGDAFKRFPAENYGVVLWNHGGGWSVLAADYDNPNAPGKRTGFQLPQITTAVTEGMRAAGVPRLALIGFDMCLMGQMEAVAEFRDLARVLVASQAIEPGAGWAYHKFLPTLSNSTATPQDLARSIVETFDASNREAREATSTLSAIDLDKAPPLLASFDALLKALQPDLPTLWAPLSRSLFWAEQYAKNGRIDDLQSDAQALASIDIVDAMKRVQGNTGETLKARGELDRFLAAAKDATILSLNSDRYRASNGLAIYAPIRAAMVKPDYAGTRLAKETAWLPFMQALHREIGQGGKAPEVTSIDIVDVTSGASVTRGTFGDNTIIRVTMKGENVLFAMSRVAEVDAANNRVILHAVGFLADTETMMERARKATDAAELLAPVYDPNGAKLSIDAPGLTLLVAAGDRFAQATIDMTNLGEAGIPFPTARALATLPSIGTVETIVEFDSITLEAVNITALIPGPGGAITPRGIQPGAETELTFLATVFYDDGRRERVPAGPAMRWNDGVRLIFDLPRPTKFRITASAESIAGAGAEIVKDLEMTLPEPRMLASIHATRSRDPQSFVGRWTLESGAPFFEIKPIQGRRTLFDVESLVPEVRENFRKAGLTTLGRIDLRRVPSLSLLYLDAQRRPKAAEHQVLLVDATNPNRMVLRSFVGTKGDARGQAIALVREGSTPPVSPPPAPQQTNPVIAPPPVAAVVPALPTPQPTPPPQPLPPPLQQAGPPQIPPNAVPPQGPQVTMNYVDPRVLLGGWRGQYRDGSIVSAMFYPNGTYEQQVQYGTRLTVNIAGQWGLQGRTLTMLVQSWSPTQFCQSPNQCQPINMPQRVDTQIEVQNNGNVIVTPDVVMQRFQ